MPQETKPKVLPEVLCEELNHIKKIDAESTSLNGIFKQLHKAELSALCFSGGGIRSATFGLGIVQALAKHNLLSKFDYLSTVSGGGYLGSWLSAWVRREQLLKFERECKEDELFEKYNTSQTDGIEKVEKLLGTNHISDRESPNQEPLELQYLRTYSNFMSPKVGLLSADTWTLIAIYVRNLFLNWTISLPLISAVLILPRIFLDCLNIGSQGASALNTYGLVFTVLSFLFGAFAVGFILYQLPSSKPIRLKKHEKVSETEYVWDTETWVVVFGVIPLVLLAFGSTALWAWVKLAENAGKPFSFPNLSLGFTISNDYPAFSAFFGLLAFGLTIGFFGSFGYLIFNRKNLANKGITYLWQVIITILSGGVGGFLVWIFAYNLNGLFPESIYKFQLYNTVAVPIFLILFLAAATLFVGLASKYIDDADREWLARFGAWVLIFSLAWVILNGLVLFGPLGIDEILKVVNKPEWDLIDYVKTTIVPVIGAISGFISLFGGFSEKSSAMIENPEKSVISKILSVAPRIAGVVFLAFIFVILTYITGFFMHYIATFLHTHNFADYLPVPKYKIKFDSYKILTENSLGYSLLWIFALSAFGTIMACFVNVNKFSLHAAYRDRLVRAYLGASKEKRHSDHFTNFDDKDNFQLHRLKGQKPFHIINATLNLLGSKNLAWQNRKGESFTMSPLHCGSWHLGYRPTSEYCRNEKAGVCEHIKYCNKTGTPCNGTNNCELKGKAIRLGTAMAISGAAANPNMGYYSSPIVTFLLALFNIRLGWWLGNTGKRGSERDRFGLGTEYYKKSCPTVAVLPLLNETLGRTNEDKRYINVTDGGHFENLALYEMVLRRCKFIVLSDGAADEEFNFGEISNAIEKCKVDLGVNIVFESGLKLFSRKDAKENEKVRMRFAVADIIYPEKNQNVNLKGTLLYIRPTFYENEPTNVLHYAKENTTFPHQSTADQQYDEQQFEAYRELGFFIMNRLIAKQKNNGLETFFDSIKNP